MKKNYSFFIIAVVIVLTIIVGAVLIDISSQEKNIISEPEISNQIKDDSEINDEVSEKTEKKENNSKPEASSELSGFSYSSTNEKVSSLESTESNEVNETHHPEEKEQTSEQSKPISNKPTESSTKPISDKPIESSTKPISNKPIEISNEPVESSKINEISQAPILPEVILSDTYITVKEGDTRRIEIINSADGAKWHIDNNAVISFVSADITGVIIKANHSGTTILTATINGTGKNLTCTVTVIK